MDHDNHILLTMDVTYYRETILKNKAELYQYQGKLKHNKLFLEAANKLNAFWWECCVK